MILWYTCNNCDEMFWSVRAKPFCTVRCRHAFENDIEGVGPEYCCDPHPSDSTFTSYIPHRTHTAESGEAYLARIRSIVPTPTQQQLKLDYIRSNKN